MAGRLLAEPVARSNGLVGGWPRMGDIRELRSISVAGSDALADRLVKIRTVNIDMIAPESVL
jgi:hypothetical protein